MSQNACSKIVIFSNGKMSNLSFGTVSLFCVSRVINKLTNCLAIRISSHAFPSKNYGWLSLQGFAFSSYASTAVAANKLKEGTAPVLEDGRCNMAVYGKQLHLENTGKNPPICPEENHP